MILAWKIKRVKCATYQWDGQCNMSRTMVNIICTSDKYISFIDFMQSYQTYYFPKDGCFLS